MMARFGDFVRRVNTKEDRFKTDRIYYVGGEHIESNELLVKSKGLIEGSTIGPMFYFGFKAGDILFVTRNPHLRKCAKVEFDGICSEKTLVLATVDNSILLQDYLALVMQSDDFWDYCEDNKSGGVNYFINWSTLEEYEFDLPSIKDQIHITNQVWSAYRLKEAYQRLLTATDEMVKSQFIEMFGDSNYSSLTLDAVAEKWLKGQPFKKDAIIPNGSQSCIHYGELFTKYGPLIYNVISTTNEELKTSSQSGDILFPASDVTPNGLTRCSMIPFDNILLGGDIIILRPKKGFDPAYLSFAINMQKVQLLKQVTGAVVKHISAKGIKQVSIPVPPLELQEEFAAIVRQADKSKFELKKAIEAIDQVIKSLING